MYLLINKCTAPHFNLALDEYLLCRKYEEFFTLWQNEPSVIIGRNQDALAEIDFDFLRKRHIHLVRRMSGGGAVFHDLGNINFSYITTCEKRDFFNFKRFSTPILAALTSLGINAEMTGRNDLTINGKKFSGNAQYMHKNRMLHHGTLLYQSNFAYMHGALRPDPEKLRGKGVVSVKSRVTNISDHLANPMPTKDFLLYLQHFILDYFPQISPYELSEADISEVRRLACEKYNSDAWNLRHMGNYKFKRSIRFSGGGIGVHFNVSAGMISDIRFTGDFFGLQDISILEDKLTGTFHDPESIKNILLASCYEEYISRISLEELLSLFF